MFLPHMGLRSRFSEANAFLPHMGRRNCFISEPNTCYLSQSPTHAIYISLIQYFKFLFFGRFAVFLMCTFTRLNLSTYRIEMGKFWRLHLVTVKAEFAFLMFHFLKVEFWCRLSQEYLGYFDKNTYSQPYKCNHHSLGWIKILIYITGW